MTDPSSALAAARVLRVVRICQLIPTVIAVYDHLITINEEMTLIWMRPWSVAKCLFLWNRYFGSAFLLVVYACTFHQGRIWFVLQGWCTGLLIWPMQCVMIFRTSAMYCRSRRIMTICLASFICEVAVMILILITSFSHISAFQEKDSGLYICTPYHLPKAIYLFWIPAIVFDVILLSLALAAGFKYFSNLNTNSMWKILLKDNLVYFSVTLTAYVINAVVWMSLPASWLEIPQAFSLMVTSVVGIRLVFNLRAAYYDVWSQSTDASSIAVTQTFDARANSVSAQWEVRGRREPGPHVKRSSIFFSRITGYSEVEAPSGQCSEAEVYELQELGNVGLGTS